MMSCGWPVSGLNIFMFCLKYDCGPAFNETEFIVLRPRLNKIMYLCMHVLPLSILIPVI